MKLVRSDYIYMDAAQCSGSYNNFSVNLPPQFKTDPTKHESLKVYVKKINIDYNFPAVTSKNNAVDINGTTYRLPTGSPSVLDLKYWFKQQGFNVEFDKIDGRFVFSTVNPMTIDMRMDDAARKMLGFENDIVTFTGKYKPPYQANVSPPNIVLVKSNLSTSSLEITAGKAKLTNILCEVTMDVPPYSTKIYRDDDGAYGISCSSLQKLEFALVDTSDNPIECQSPPYFIVCIELYRDDEKALLESTLNHHRISRLNILANAP
jgi:hypothetical protein